MRDETEAAWSAVIEEAKLHKRPAGGKSLNEFARESGLPKAIAKGVLADLVAAGKVKAVQCHGKGGMNTVYLPAGKPADVAVGRRDGGRRRR